MTKEYIYKNPLENGYKQFKLTTKQHNSLFPNRPKKWYNKFEYYYNDKRIILHKFSNKLAIFLNTLLFPIYLLIHGLIKFKEIKNELKELYNQKKYGTFSSDNIECKSELYQKVMKLIK